MRPLRLTCILVLILFAAGDLALAGRYRVRARENYESISVATNDGSHRYAGFSHTFNIWYENPFNWAFGLATGPYVMEYKEAPNQSERPGTLKGKIKLLNHGFELKKWYDLEGLQFFLRGGGYFHQFRSNTSTGSDRGYGWLLGVGYEHNFDGIGLAFEIDRRDLILRRTEWSISANMIAIGVHFYDLL